MSVLRKGGSVQLDGFDPGPAINPTPGQVRRAGIHAAAVALNQDWTRNDLVVVLQQLGLADSPPPRDPVQRGTTGHIYGRRRR